MSNKILFARHDEEISIALEQGKLKKIEVDVPWKVWILFKYLNSNMWQLSAHVLSHLSSNSRVSNNRRLFFLPNKKVDHPTQVLSYSIKKCFGLSNFFVPDQKWYTSHCAGQKHFMPHQKMIFIYTLSFYRSQNLLWQTKTSSKTFEPDQKMISMPKDDFH